MLAIVSDIALLISLTVFSAGSILLLAALMLGPDEHLDWKRLSWIIQAKPGNPKKGKAAKEMLVPPVWVRIPERWASDLREENVRAGVKYPYQGRQLALWAILAGKEPLALGLIVFFLALLGTALMGADVIPRWAGFLLLGAFAALGWREFTELSADLRKLGDARMETMRRQLPYAADMFVMVLDAGGEFDESLDAYHYYGPPGPLHEELRIARQEIRAGTSREKALMTLSTRCPIPELKRFALAITQSERTGMPLSEVLHNQADLLRMERSQRGTELAERMAIDSQGWKMGIALAAVLLIIGPMVLSMIAGMGRLGH